MAGCVQWNRLFGRVGRIVRKTRFLREANFPRISCGIATPGLVPFVPLIGGEDDARLRPN